MQHPLNANVFETHSFIYIRIPIDDEDWLKNMKIFHTSNQSMIHGVPNDDDKHIISLPALVRKKGTTVQYQRRYFRNSSSKTSRHSLFRNRYFRIIKNP